MQHIDIRTSKVSCIIPFDVDGEPFGWIVSSCDDDNYLEIFDKQTENKIVVVIRDGFYLAMMDGETDSVSIHPVDRVPMVEAYLDVN